MATNTFSNQELWKTDYLYADRKYYKQSDLSNRTFRFIDNYIYLYHLDTFIVLPEYPDNVSDSMGANFQSSTPLARSAPIWSYSGSGPRTVTASFSLHRDMMHQLNYQTSNLDLSTLGVDDDYVDFLIKGVQASVMPDYDAATKAVNPPMVAMRLGNDIFIKGIIQSAPGVTYKLPILRNGKYACIDFSISITEVDAYSAKQVLDVGSFRGLSTTLERGLYRNSGV